MNKNVYTVEKVNLYIKNMFAQDFMLKNISIKGEVSNCKYHTSGHVYFSLKDSGGALSCVMFRGNRKGLSFQMKDGDQVVVTGSVEVYDRNGTYQLYAREISLDGEGNLYLQMEQLKRELYELGMFDDRHKKKIPGFAGTIGIVTARTGAAIQDIRNVATRRNPQVQLILYPALVQGDGAAESIVQGIKALDSYGVDVIIVGRGGGSIEDLWAFNERIVAQAIFDCQTPIVSAVGHEVDWTIADFVADFRAPTPSAAAELCAFDRIQVKNQLLAMQSQLSRSLYNKSRLYRERLAHMGQKLRLLSPQHKLREKLQRVAVLSDRLETSMSMKLKDARARVGWLAKALEGCSPLKKLESGFAYVETDRGVRVRSVSQISGGDLISVQFLDGKVLSRVETLHKAEQDFKPESTD